jgi:hypothetical protein
MTHKVMFVMARQKRFVIFLPLILCAVGCSGGAGQGQGVQSAGIVSSPVIPPPTLVELKPNAIASLKNTVDAILGDSSIAGAAPQRLLSTMKVDR